MSPFEYVIVLVSIILGLGITTLLTGVADWIKHRASALLYPPYLIWILIVFILHLHEWWESYSYRSITEWPLLTFLVFLLYPINLYVLAHLLFPADHQQDYTARDFYRKNWPRLFTCALFLPIISIAQNVFISGYGWDTQIVQIIVFLSLLSVTIIRARHEVVHYMVAILFLAVMIVSLFTVKEQLVIQN
jgi:hypothetical protein